MAVIPSVCGDGMAIALHTGFLAADYFGKSNAFEYHCKARQELLGQINHATFMASLLSSSLFQPLAFLSSSIFPALISNFIRSTRLKTFK
jgi:hypothetical protein